MHLPEVSSMTAFVQVRCLIEHKCIRCFIGLFGMLTLLAALLCYDAWLFELLMHAGYGLPDTHFSQGC